MSWVRRVSLEPTDLCNANCPFCPRDYYEEHVATGKRMWTLEEAKDILDKLKALGNVKKINFGLFGEPTIHPKLPEIVKYAKYLDFYTGISSNCILMTPKLVKQLGENLDHLNISVYGFDEESYFKSHGVPLWDTVWNNLQFISGAGRHAYNWNLTTNCVLSNETAPYMKELEDFLRPRVDTFWWSREITRMGLHRVEPWALLSEREPFCVDQIAVTVNGWVVPCCNHNFGEVILGNIWEKRLRDILEDEVRGKLNKALLSGEGLSHTCQECRFKHWFREPKIKEKA